MQLPADLVRMRAVVAAAGANITTVGGVGRVLGAPGAGLRYRVWGYTLILATTATGAGTFLRGGWAPGGAAVHDVAGERSGEAWYPGGYAIGVNQSIDLFDQCSTAAAPLVHSLFYTVEAV